LQFLDFIEEHSSVTELVGRVVELLEFLQELEMGSFYVKRIDELVCPLHINSAGRDRQTRYYNLWHDKPSIYRQRLKDVQSDIHELIVEQLRFQNWP
jgi:hypothetical protein